MKTNKTFFTAWAVAAVVASMLCACNQDVQLGTYEDAPKVAEALIGKTAAEATAYLEKQGFYFGDKADYSNEYVFSKDASLKEFSYEASIMLMFGTFEGDTVKYAAAMQRMQTEKSARDLYWKWSHYTGKITMPHVDEYWGGSIHVKDAEQSHIQKGRASYYEGTATKEMLNERKEQYQNGIISKEEYDHWIAVYSQGREQFWADYKREGDNIESVIETYRNEGNHPNEIGIKLYTNNGGEIELYYETRDFIVHWVSPAAK